MADVVAFTFTENVFAVDRKIEEETKMEKVERRKEGNKANTYKSRARQR